MIYLQSWITRQPSCAMAARGTLVPAEQSRRVLWMRRANWKRGGFNLEIVPDKGAWHRSAAQSGVQGTPINSMISI